MRKTAFLLFCLLFLLTFSAPLSAQQGGNLTINSVNDTNFPELQLLITVTDAQGLPVLDLASDDLAVNLEGTPLSVQQVDDIVNDDLGISVVLVLDTSESMLGKPLDDTIAAANSFIDRLRPQDEVAVIEFDSDVNVVQDFTTDKDAARAVINGLVADGRTALYEASLAGAELALQANTPRRFVIFLTDGNEYGGVSGNPAEAGIQLANENSIPFYTIGLGYSINEPYMRALAGETYGTAYILPDSQQLTEIFDFLGDFLRNQYVITLPTDLEPDGSTYTLQATYNGLTGETAYTAPDLYPQIALSGLPEEGTAVEEEASLALEIDAPRGLTSLDILLDGDPYPVDGPSIAVADSPTSYSQTLPLQPETLPPGEHQITVTASDAEGGQRTFETTFTVTQIPAQVNISGVEEGDVLDTDSLTLSVAVTQSQTPVEEVVFLADGTEISTVQDAPYETTLDVLALGPGSHTLAVTVREVSGTETTREFPITVDDALFVTPSATPTPTATATAMPTNTGTLPPTDTATATATATATPLPTDTATATATATSLPSDTPPPISFEVTGIQTNDVIDEPTREITVTATDGDDEIERVVFTIDTATSTTLDEAPFVYTLDALALGAGAHTLRVSVVSQAGSTNARTFIFFVDQALFVTPSPSDTATPQATPTLAPTTTLAPTDTPRPLTFTITGLEDGAVVSQPVLEIGVEVEGEDDAPPPGVTVRVTVDDEEQETADEPPYTASIDVLELGPGTHEVEVAVETEDGQTDSRSLTFSADEALFITPTAAPDDDAAADDEDSTINDLLPYVVGLGILLLLAVWFLVRRAGQQPEEG